MRSEVMEDFFFIPHDMLKGEPPAIGYELFALEYAGDTLGIPLEHIKDAHYNGDGFMLHLKMLDEYITNHDWYANLFGISNYIRAS